MKSELLIAVEGLDGSGKATLVASVADRLREQGLRAVTLAFPRYGASPFADQVHEALYGRLGDLGSSVTGMATLFALDRLAATPQIRGLLSDHDVVLLDRYITSNAAYGAARLGGPIEDTGFPSWVQDLEIDRMQIPVPDLQLLLATPADESMGRSGGSADGKDAFESDTGLQLRTAAMYGQLARDQFLSPWRVLDPADAADEAVRAITNLRRFREVA